MTDRPETYHQIFHGDSTEVLQLLDDGSIDCVITDPPFGIDNLSNRSETEAGKRYARKIANDESPEQAIEVFYSVMDALAPKMSDDCDMYIFTAHTVLAEWIMLARNLDKYGLKYKSMLIWDKGECPGLGDLNSWGVGYEVALFLKKGKKERQIKRPSGILPYKVIPAAKLIHPHEKPEPLLEKLIKFSTKPGELVVDPFGGSGATVRAARNTGRSGVAIELDEYNHSQAVRKLEETQSLF